jgi:hypothetical protein
MLACLHEKIKKLHVFNLWGRGIGFSGGLGGGGAYRIESASAGGGGVNSRVIDKFEYLGRFEPAV